MNVYDNMIISVCEAIVLDFNYLRIANSGWYSI